MSTTTYTFDRVLLDLATTTTTTIVAKSVTTNAAGHESSSSTVLVAVEVVGVVRGSIRHRVLVL